MGTAEFAVPSLETLAYCGYMPAAVVTGPDKQRGRGRRVSPTPVKVAAQALGVTTILQPENVKAAAFAENVAALDPDIIVVAAYSILPPGVFETARLGSFNLHASLLPHYRGAAPINRALMAGETGTGVTTFFLQQKVDTGNIILRWPTRIPDDEDAGCLHDRLKLLGARAVLETVRRIEQGRAHAAPQDHSRASPAPKIFRDDCRIPWLWCATAVHNHCRGLSPWPGAWTRHNGRDLKILGTRVACGTGAPGTILESAPRLRVACGTGAVEILRLQQQGHRRMNATDFLNGYALHPGDSLH